MSPILLRPIREQFEHDRVIRQLQPRLRRRFGVAINPGEEREASVWVGDQPRYPDLVLTNTTGGRRLHGVVEVETVQSVNRLEAMAQWAHLAKARGAFYLYVPAGMADVAGRLCADGRINVTEIWTYYAIGRQVRFSMAYRSPRATRDARLKGQAKNAKKKVAKKATKSKTTKRSAAARAKKAKVGSGAKTARRKAVAKRKK